MSKLRFLSLTLILCFVGMSGAALAQTSPLAFQADADLHPGLEALYAALYDGAAPVYADADADVLVTSDTDALADAADTLPDYFLPGAGIVALTDNPDAAAFVAFAVSPDGQQALIDAGLLPAVVTIVDQAGNTLEIPQPVRRAITPHSIATYTVYAVGAGDRLVGGAFLGARDEPGATRMAQIDPRFPELSSYTMSQREINVEQVAALAPDVILTSTRSQWLDSVAELNIPVVLFAGESPDALKEAVHIIGQIFGPNTAAQADAWAAYYDSILAKVTSATDKLDTRPGVLFTSEEPLRVASGEMYQTAMVAAAGGTSVSGELTGFWNDVNLEQVLVWNPDAIFSVPYGGVSPQTFLDSPEWQAVSAVQNGRVYKMPSYVAPWDTPIPESVLGIIWMTQTLYPDLVDLDCAAETDYFYRTFYAYPLPEAEIAALCATT